MHWLSSVYWAVKTQIPYGSKWLLRKAHSRFNYNKPNHLTDNKISLWKILSGHWLHKNIQPSKGEGTKRPKEKPSIRTRGQGKGRRWGKQLSTSFFNEERGRMTLYSASPRDQQCALIGGMKDCPQPLTLSWIYNYSIIIIGKLIVINCLTLIFGWRHKNSICKQIFHFFSKNLCWERGHLNAVQLRWKVWFA